MHPQLTEALVFGRGLLDVRHHRPLQRRVRGAVERHELVRVLPGVYAPPGPLSPQLACRALALADPRAVLLGRSAALALDWTDIAPGHTVTAASSLRSRPGFEFRRDQLPDSVVVTVNGIRMTTPALTALDLALDPRIGPGVIDDALRRGVRLRHLAEVLHETPHRPGNAQRWALVKDSRDNPWSEAERSAHRALRAAGVRGWAANARIALRTGHCYADLAFAEVQLVIEIDGRLIHEPWARRVQDLARDRRLVTAGWTVVRFPAEEVLADEGHFVSEVLDLVRSRRRRLCA